MSLDEIEVYDTSVSYSRGRMPEDTWFFMGDSITAFWANRATAGGTPPAYTNDPASHMPDFAQWINTDNPHYFPSMINGGIGGELTPNGLARLPANLADNPELDPLPVRWGYTVFGKVIDGQDVLDRISTVPTGAEGKFKADAPLSHVVIQKIELLGAGGIKQNGPTELAPAPTGTEVLSPN